MIVVVGCVGGVVFVVVVVFEYGDVMCVWYVGGSVMVMLGGVDVCVEDV